MRKLLIVSKADGREITLAEVEVYGVDAVVLSNESFIKNNSVQIYPNPVSQSFAITNSDGANVNVYNTEGKLLISNIINSNNHFVNAVDFTKGVYFVKINNDGYITNKKIIKQ